MTQKILKVLSCLVVVLVGLSCPCRAKIQNYGSEDRSYVSRHSDPWVNKAENYLNGIKYLKTSFVQNNPDGSISKGTLYISRPDKMRMDYKSPNPFVILSDGQYIHQYDPELDESSKIDLDLTPAIILLNETVKFSGKIKLLNVKKSGQDILIKVAKLGEEDSGTLTFRFQRYPFDLKGWSVLDQNGQRITVHLSKEKQRPGNLDYSLFRLHKGKRRP